MLTEVDLFNQALAGIGEYRIRLETAKTITAATAANPVSCTVTAHGYSDDDLVLVTAMDQMTQVNGRVFRIDSTGSNSFTLLLEDGTAYTAETGGGLVQRLRSGEHNQKVFGAWPSVRREVLEEHSWNEATRYARLSRLQAAKTITAVTQASPAVVTSAAHGYSQGDFVLIDGIVGMTELNGRYFTVGAVTTNTFELAGESSTTFTAYSSGGSARKALTPLRPDFLYDYRYTLPADFVRVLGFAEPGYESEAWEVVGSELFTDYGITVPIRYTTLLKDPAAFGGQLYSALVSRLAHELAPAVTDSTSREERAEKRWERQLERAKSSDGKESGPSTIAEAPTSWIAARRG